MASNKDAQIPDILGCVTPERIALFQAAVSEINNEINRAVLQSNTYFSMPKRHQAQWRRAYCVGVLKKTFDTQEGVTIRQDRGGFYLVLDGQLVIHPKKLERKSHRAWIPKLLRTSTGPRQLPLSDEFVTDENVPLNQREAIVAGFIENEFGQLIAFYFTSQEGNSEPLILMELPIVNIVPFEQVDRTDTSIPKPVFNRKQGPKSGTSESTA